MISFPKNWMFMTALVILAIFVLLFVPMTKNSWATPGPKSGGDLELLARIIRAEAEAEPYTGQVAVGSVILNRVQNPKFPKTIAGVVYQPKAFESVSNGQVNTPPSVSARKAAQAAIGGWDPSGGALFFFNPSKVGSRSYIWSRKVIQKIGKHVFAL